MLWYKKYTPHAVTVKKCRSKICEELEKRRQAEQRQHEINKQREQERQAGAEIDDLFNSMRK